MRKKRLDGQGTDCHGYRYVRVGNGRRKAVHVLIAEKSLGRELRGSEDVHHVNEDRNNNDPSNLVICPDRRYHKLLHIRTAALSATGNPEMRKCCHCKQYDTKESMFNGAALSKGYDESYRHRSCYNAAAAESHRRNYVQKALRRVAP